MAGKRLLFIYNRRSGRGIVRLSLSGVIDVFSRAGYESIVYSTQYPGDATEKVEHYAAEVDVVACAGGDGTLNEVITGVMNSKKDLPVFYLPAGSTNDFAVSLGIPRNQIAAAEAAVDGRMAHVDIGKFNDRYFSYVAAFGLLTDVSYATDQNLKNRIGYLAYLIEGGKRLLNIPVIEMTVQADDRIYCDKFLYGMVTNATQIGGLRNINITGTNIELDDGVFELTLVRATTNPVEFAEAVNVIASGGQSKFVIRDKAARIEFHSETPVAWTLSGEDGGKHNDVVIENMRRALTIAVPGGKEAETLLTEQK